MIPYCQPNDNLSLTHPITYSQPNHNRDSTVRSEPWIFLILGNLLNLPNLLNPTKKGAFLGVNVRDMLKLMRFRQDMDFAESRF